ncbi:MAG: OmpA family protein [Mucilaginibacter sp.]|nr:OmpA family protein [Mucilaginibacter sp.]
MAQLDVQPKEHSSAWLLIIFLILAAGAAVLLYKGCNKSSFLKVDATDTVRRDTTRADSNNIAAVQTDWGKVDFNIPRATYEEITDTIVTVKSNDHYGIYSLKENNLFKKEDSKIAPASEAALQQVVTSLIKRYRDANIGVYVYNDSTVNAGENKGLGAARANAVEEWLTKQGRLPVDQVSIHWIGDQQSLVDNATVKDRAINRSIEIVALPDNTSQ